MKIKIGIIGYGNLGKGVETAIKNTNDMELVGVFTRRNPQYIKSDANVYDVANLNEWKDKLDVCVLCGGSATDILVQAPEIVANFNAVDCFDTHAKIPQYFNILDKIASAKGTLALISTGWDPGLFSINRVLAESVLPKGETHTFWGKGVSQGHGDAIRRIEGVKDATQYTIPNQEIIAKIKKGEPLDLTSGSKHTRECFVVVDDAYDKEKIREKIVNMPNYFAEYKTTVHFIDMETLERDHKKMPHGGQVIRIGKTSNENKHTYEFTLNLDSNPEFTASTTIAYARAVYRMSKEGKTGAITVFDVPVKNLTEKSYDELLANYL